MIAPVRLVPFQLNKPMRYGSILHRVSSPSGLRGLVPKSWNGTRFRLGNALFVEVQPLTPSESASGKLGTIFKLTHYRLAGLAKRASHSLLAPRLTIRLQSPTVRKPAHREKEQPSLRVSWRAARRQPALTRIRGFVGLPHLANVRNKCSDLGSESLAPGI
jgi:hypothetical protein